VFYSFDVQQILDPMCKFDLKTALRAANLLEYYKMVTFPLGKNKFTLRLENLADDMDNGKGTYLDLNAIIKALWDNANCLNPIDIDQIVITEQSLTGNMELSEMQKRKIQWQDRDHYDSSNEVK